MSVCKVNDCVVELNLSHNQLGEHKTGLLLQQALGESITSLAYLVYSARPPTKKELFQIIRMHMMTREIIPGRKTEGSTVSSIDCDRSSLI